MASLVKRRPNSSQVRAHIARHRQPQTLPAPGGNRPRYQGKEAPKIFMVNQVSAKGGKALTPSDPLTEQMDHYYDSSVPPGTGPWEMSTRRITRKVEQRVQTAPVPMPSYGRVLEEEEVEAQTTQVLAARSATMGR